MWSSALGLCLFLSAIYGGEPAATPEPQYMLLVPSVLKAGHEHKFCLQFSHLNESLSVTVALEAEENVTLLESHVTESEEDNCFPFQTPDVDSAKVAYMTLNAVGDTLHFKTKRSILIRPLFNLVFIQTDKPIYKPGQTVHFRVASLDEHFRATNEKFPVIYIQDPQRNRISQWANVETRRGIAQNSFLLAAEPRMGTYKVIAQRNKGSQIEQDFTVEEYVLPKYDVQVNMPSVITILDDALMFKVCGKYTYGQPVSGKIDVRVCRKFQRYATCGGAEDSVCEELSDQADSEGCFSDMMKTKMFQLKRNGYEMKLTATAKITEDGTGVELSGEASSEIKSTISKASFRQLDSHFKRGIPLFGQIFLEDAAGKPMSNHTVTLFVGNSGTNFTHTTGPDGTADFSIDTKSFHSSINLRVSHKSVESCYSQWSQSPRYEEASRTINHFYSRSESYLKIQPIYRTLKCPEEEKLIIHYTLTPKGAGEKTHAEFHHVIMSKGAIVASGKHKVELNATGESHGQFTLTLPVTVKTSPLAKVLVYTILDKGEVIADRVDFTVEKCFENQVQLSLSNKEVLPGASTNLVISSLPNSLCALRGVDSSVLLLKPEAELSADSVYKLLQVTDLSGYNHDGHDLEEPSEEPCLKLEPIFLNGVYYQPTLPPSEVDAYTILKEFGLKVATNTMIRIPRPCQEVHAVSYAIRESSRSFAGYHAPMAMRGEMRQFDGAPGSAASVAEESFIESVRKFFPETFLWDLVEMDDIGQTAMKLKAPDSITTWKIGAFCMSEDGGFGLADTKSLVTFQPFFLDITMPHSAVRGEKFNMKTSVFNYLKQAIRVKMTLEGSDKFTAKKINGDDEGYCIGANKRMTINWEVMLQSLGEVDITMSAQTIPDGGHCGNEIMDLVQGRKDTITKHIQVEAEGVQKEETHSAMICNQGSDTTEKITLKLPKQVVKGSGRAHFSVVGDIMGTAMQNLDNLLQMPAGCAEQIVALLTPNIYALEYLNATGQLTPDLKSKALTHLSTGYQRLLMHKQPDGSYSVFGSRFSQGNTWLTAFVLRSFARAQSHIFIDPKHISDSLTWLSRQQKENGCFQNIGSLFNNAMKGGVNDEVALTAYITITLLEMHRPVTDVVVRNALFGMESALQGDLSIYTKSLLAYAFTLARKMDIRSHLLNSLDEKAIKQEGTIHWLRPEFSEGSGRRIWTPSSRAPSLEIEMTSYVLLAMLHKPELTNEDLTHATKVVSWLIKQQNPNGGFTSTQDTVVALQALATYGHHAHKHDGPREVAVTADGAPVAKLHVDDSNRLLLQRASLPDVPGDYSVVVRGPGCVFIQSVLKYNVPPPEGDAPFTLTVNTVPQECTAKSIKGFSISVNVSYTGSRNNSNMAIVDVKLPSGFSPVKSSVKQLTSNNVIKMASSEPNKVIVYFEKLTKDVQTFMFSVEQDIPMSNLRPATASVSDYYETGDYAVIKYSAPCS